MNSKQDFAAEELYPGGSAGGCEFPAILAERDGGQDYLLIQKLDGDGRSIDLASMLVEISGGSGIEEVEVAGADGIYYRIRYSWRIGAFLDMMAQVGSSSAHTFTFSG